MRNRRPRNIPNKSSGAITSICAGVKMRGTPHQLAEKHQALGDDAEDPVIAELHYQHAHHYRTIIQEPRP